MRILIIYLTNIGGICDDVYILVDVYSICIDGNLKCHEYAAAPLRRVLLDVMAGCSEATWGWFRQGCGLGLMFAGLVVSGVVFRCPLKDCCSPSDAEATKYTKKHSLVPVKGLFE